MELSTVTLISLRISRILQAPFKKVDFLRQNPITTELVLILVMEIETFILNWQELLKKIPAAKVYHQTKEALFELYERLILLLSRKYLVKPIKDHFIMLNTGFFKLGSRTYKTGLNIKWHGCNLCMQINGFVKRLHIL